MPSKTTPGGTTSIAHGQQKFNDTGCSLCHTPTLQTSSVSEFAATTNVPVNLFSDLVVHKMGPNLRTISSRDRPTGMNSEQRRYGGSDSEFSFFMMAGRMISCRRSMLMRVPEMAGMPAPRQTK